MGICLRGLIGSLPISMQLCGFVSARNLALLSIMRPGTHMLGRLHVIGNHAGHPWTGFSLRIVYVDNFAISVNVS